MIFYLIPTWIIKNILNTNIIYYSLTTSVCYTNKYFVNCVLYKVPGFYCLMLINWIDNINFIFKKMFDKKVKLF